MTYLEHSEMLNELAWAIQCQSNKIKAYKKNANSELYGFFPHLQEKNQHAIEIAEMAKKRLEKRYKNLCKI